MRELGRCRLWLIIDVKKSLVSGQVTLWSGLEDATSSFEQIEKRSLI
jgi:hypothetical protein